MDRRTVLTGAAALATAGCAAGASAQEAQVLEAAIRRIIGDVKPTEGRITLTIPELSENGNTVPFEVVVDSPMTARDHVRSVHVIAPANPQPDIAGYEFSALSGRAAVSSRMRLARSQDVYALAVMSDGGARLARQTVKVTIGGCGG
jgi:sulfur-oxidizing protein SoxY